MTKSAVHSTLETSDGREISYYEIGQGPGLIIIHGAISSALTQLELAEALSEKYTVYMYSRRLRGLSAPYPESITTLNILNKNLKDSKSQTLTKSVYDPAFAAAVLQIDISDLAALIQHTNSIYLLGVSGGAIVALEGLLSDLAPLHAIQKAIIFEPPLSFAGHTTPGEKVDLSLLARIESEISATPPDIASALVTAMLAGKQGPPALQSVPRFLLKSMTRLMCHYEDEAEAKRLKAGGEDRGSVTMRQLCPSLRYEFAVAEGSSSLGLERFGHLDPQRVMMLGGSESPGYLKVSVRLLEGAIKGAKRTEIAGVGHGVLGNKDRHGNVGKAVGIIEEFFN